MYVCYVSMVSGGAGVERKMTLIMMEEKLKDVVDQTLPLQITYLG